MLSNMTLLTSVMGMSYNGVTEVRGGVVGGGREWLSATCKITKLMIATLLFYTGPWDRRECLN